MGIRRQTFGVQIAPEIMQMFFGEAAFQKGAGIHTGTAVSLEKDQIAGTFIRSFEEMILGYFVQIGGG